MQPKQGGYKKETSLQRFWKRNVPSRGDQKPEAQGMLKIVGLLKGKRFRLCLRSNGAHIRSLRGSDMITCALTCHHRKQCLTGVLLF